MGSDLFLYTTLFAAGTALLAFLAINSTSRLRFLAPVLVILSMAVAYGSLDRLLGLAKPIQGYPMWSAPRFGPNGATVIGGQVGSDEAYLLLVEDGSQPRLYHMHGSSETMRQLRQTMQRLKDETGQPWGFKIVAGGKPTGDGEQGGRAGGSGAGAGRGEGGQGASVGFADAPEHQGERKDTASR